MAYAATTVGTLTDEEHAAELRKAVIAATVGTTIEWYDFFIYGTAAGLIFPALYFPKEDPLTGTLAAFGTYFVGFVGRPIGAAIFGHYGDRIGRKATLIATLLLMAARERRSVLGRTAGAYSRLNRRERGAHDLRHRGRRRNRRRAIAETRGVALWQQSIEPMDPELVSLRRCGIVDAKAFEASRLGGQFDRPDGRMVHIQAGRRTAKRVA